MRVGAGAAGAVACWLACAGLADAQTTTYPTPLEREPLLVWLQRETDILPNQVVAVTPQALTSIVSSFPAGGGLGPRVVIRAEALTPEIVARTGAMSWHVSLSADCSGRRVKLGETTGYPERNLLGERKVLRMADAEWRALEAGTALEHAWRAACDPAFAGPFRSASVKLAQTDGAAAPASTSSPATPAQPAPAQPAPVQPAPVRAAAPPPQRSQTPPPPPKAPAPQPARRGGLVAQVGAVASEADARALLSSMSDRIAGRPTWVEAADVGGRTWRRAVVGGFADGPAAARFCADLRAAGRACFVRASTGR